MSNARLLVSLRINEAGYVELIGSKPVLVNPGELKSWRGGDFIVIIYRKLPQAEPQDEQEPAS